MIRLAPLTSWGIALTLATCLLHLSACVSATRYRCIQVERDSLKSQALQLQDDLARTRIDLERGQQDLITLQDKDSAAALVARLRETVEVLQRREQSLRDQLSATEETIRWHRAHNDSLSEQLRVKTIEADKVRDDAQGCHRALAQLIEAAKTPAVVESQIDGDFEGWEGETVFVLTNGQIWQQTSYDYIYEYAYMPEVLIYATSDGYKMRVEDVDETIYVTRIK